MQDINIRVGQFNTYYLEGAKKCEGLVSGKDTRTVGKERGKSEVIFPLFGREGDLAKIVSYIIL